MRAVLLLLGVLLRMPLAAQVQSLPCPETRFLVPTTNQLWPPVSDSLRLADFARLRALDRDCTPPRIRVRQLSGVNGSRVRLRWHDCPLYFEGGPVFYGIPAPRPAPLRFRGVVPADCSRLEAHFRARWYGQATFVARDFTADVSRCGDGILDIGAGEECEPPDGYVCLSDCRLTGCGKARCEHDDLSA